MKKQIFSILAVGLVSGLLVGCGSSYVVKVDKPSDEATDKLVKKALKITEDENNVIHIKWDLSNTSGYGLILEYDNHKKALARGMSHEILEMTCEPTSSTTSSIDYECNKKGETNSKNTFTVYDKKNYYFKIESLGKDSYGTTQWVLSDPVATLTLQGLK